MFVKYKTCKSIHNHATKPLLDYSTSVSENVHISQVITNSNVSKENSENVQTYKQYGLFLIKYKYGRLVRYFGYCNESLIEYFKTLNKVKLIDVKTFSQLHSKHKKWLSVKFHCLFSATKNGKICKECECQTKYNKIKIFFNFETDLTRSLLLKI